MSLAEASQLATAYRDEQVRLRASVLAQLWQAWQLLDPDDVGGSFDAALPGLVSVVEAGAHTAVDLAATFLDRYVDLGIGRRSDVWVEYLGDRPLVSSILAVAGRITALQRIGRGASATQALEDAFVRTARAAGSRTLDAGRVALELAMDAEPLVIGWQRVTSGSPCQFCAGLAARGPVYRERTARFDAHPNCACTAEPVLRGAKVKGRPAPQVGHERTVEIDEFWAKHNARYAERREQTIQARIALGQRVRGRNPDGSRRAQPDDATAPETPAPAPR